MKNRKKAEGVVTLRQQTEAIAKSVFASTFCQRHCVGRMISESCAMNSATGVESSQTKIAYQNCISKNELNRL